MTTICSKANLIFSYFSTKNFNKNNHEERINATDEIHAAVYNFVDTTASQMNCVLKPEMSNLCISVCMLCFTTTDVRMVLGASGNTATLPVSLTAINSLST